MFSKAGKSFDILEGVKQGNISDFYLAQSVADQQIIKKLDKQPGLTKELESSFHNSVKEKIKYFQDENDSLRKLLEEIALVNQELKRKLGFAELDDSEDITD
ncbi:MAG: hypothetical protein R2757_16195 [Draconibacterium sp.]